MNISYNCEQSYQWKANSIQRSYPSFLEYGSILICYHTNIPVNVREHPTEHFSSSHVLTSKISLLYLTTDLPPQD